MRQASAVRGAGFARDLSITQEKVERFTNCIGNAEIYYRTYILRADEVTYNSDTGETTAQGHFTLDGGPNDDHIKASHGTYNLTAETGRFYDVTGTTGLRFHGNRVVLTSTAPFAFTGKIVEKPSPDHYLVYDGTITTCELPHPKWQFHARNGRRCRRQRHNLPQHFLAARAARSLFSLCDASRGPRSPRDRIS